MTPSSSEPLDLARVEEELEKIRRRHALMESPPYAYATRTMGHWIGEEGQRAHADRAFLLDCVTRLAEAVEERTRDIPLKELRRLLEAEIRNGEAWARNANDAWIAVHSALDAKMAAQEDNARLRAALETAKSTIRTWSEMGSSAPPGWLDEEWSLYQESPEMKLINAALAPRPTPPGEAR